MRARAQQWSRMAYAIALLFGSLPLASRLLLGSSGFDGAAVLAALFFIAGSYFLIVSRRLARLADPASMLDQAAQFAASGRTDRALRVLSRTIRESPRFWQAYQHRGALYLQLGDPHRALADFAHASRLAPDEPGLYLLRDQARSLIGPDSLS